MVNMVTEKLDTYISYKDLKLNLKHCQLLELLLEANYIHEMPTAENQAEVLSEFIEASTVGDFVYLCNLAESLRLKTLAFQLRKLLNPKRFGWEWQSVRTGDVLLKSSHTSFLNEYGCKLDGLKHRFHLNSSTDVTLIVTAYYTNGKPIGKVNEVKDGETQTVVPGKRKAATKVEASECKRKMTYELKLSENLGDDVIMQVFLQNNEYTVDLRRWAPDKNKKLQPTKKGIRLSLQCFIRLVWMRERVQQFLDQMKAGHRIDEKLLVGGPVFVKLNSPFLTVHLREYYAEGNKLKPGSKGIIIKLRHWQKILDIAQDMDRVVPEFNSMKPCSFDGDHANQEGMLNCTICNYFGDDLDFE